MGGRAGRLGKLLFGSSADYDSDRVCADSLSQVIPGRRRSVAPCQAMPYQLSPPKRPVVLSASVPPSCSSIDQAAALRVFAFTVSTCSSSVRLAQLFHQPDLL